MDALQSHPQEASCPDACTLPYQTTWHQNHASYSDAPPATDADADPWQEQQLASALAAQQHSTSQSLVPLAYKPVCVGCVDQTHAVDVVDQTLETHLAAQTSTLVDVDTDAGVAAAPLNYSSCHYASSHTHQHTAHPLHQTQPAAPEKTPSHPAAANTLAAQTTPHYSASPPYPQHSSSAASPQTPATDPVPLPQTTAAPDRPAPSPHSPSHYY
mmetsp:Transcript_5521/g.10823  ORF Transcript_5521/g.10823 Transcript_5521/m.10823 type:complete len:214 (-) Transcript_5521:333-974(-)